MALLGATIILINKLSMLTITQILKTNGSVVQISIENIRVVYKNGQRV